MSWSSAWGDGSIIGGVHKGFAEFTRAGLDRADSTSDRCTVCRQFALVKNGRLAQRRDMQPEEVYTIADSISAGLRATG
jgi:hypothetical protein